MRNWWTAEDRAEFESRTGWWPSTTATSPLTIWLSTGSSPWENIGDLGGITIGLLAYQLSLDGAMPWRRWLHRASARIPWLWPDLAEQASPGGAAQRIMTDPHSPSKYRANGAVRNVPEFYEAFAVSLEDALYLPPEARVKIQAQKSPQKRAFLSEAGKGGQPLPWGISAKGTFLSGRMSAGIPSTRSAMMLRRISSVPPAMRSPGALSQAP